MISIDKDLEHAASGASDWSSDAARAAADSLARRRSAKVDWDDGAGEEWLRVVDDHHVAALVSARIPLAIIEVAGDTDAGMPPQVAAINVHDLDETELSASLEALAEAFGSPARFHALDLSGFSGNDLWYATV